MSQRLVVRCAPPEPDPELDYHLKRADEERERALAASSPGIVALHVELGRLHAAAIGGKGFEPGLLARIIDEAPDAGASSLKRVQCGGGGGTAAIARAGRLSLNSSPARGGGPRSGGGAGRG